MLLWEDAKYSKTLSRRINLSERREEGIFYAAKNNVCICYRRTIHEKGYSPKKKFHSSNIIHPKSSLLFSFII